MGRETIGAARDTVERAQETLGRHAGHTRHAAEDFYGRAADAAEHAYGYARHRLDDGGEFVTREITHRPLMSALVFGLVGFAIGYACRERHRQ